MPNMKETGLRWLWISVIVLLLDHSTKVLAQKYLIFNLPKPIFPCFNLTLAYNKGSAFGFLNSASGWQVYFFGLISFVVVMGILTWMMRVSSNQRWLNIALALIIGGALGNLWDRI